MEPRFLLTFAFITLVFAVSHATPLPEQYWSSVLPNTPMPKVIKDLLSSDFLEDKSTSVNVGKGGVNVHTAKGKQGGTSVGVGKGGVNVHTGHKKPVYVAVKPGYNPFNYVYAATEDQLHDDPNVALFFLEKNLRPGTKLILHFPETSPAESTFLPREVTKKIPFSSNELPQILDQFSVKPTTLEAELIERTIKECEAPNMTGEDKYCATSLESMVDFSTSKLGKKVTAISTEVEKKTTLQEFTVSGVVKKSVQDRAVVCHKQSYPYAVFYCHSTQHTRAYKVGLVGVDGTRVNAVAVCHTDTSAWNPKHLAFQVLKVKPGTIPVCHFLPQDHVVWVSN